MRSRVRCLFFVSVVTSYSMLKLSQSVRGHFVVVIEVGIQLIG